MNTSRPPELLPGQAGRIDPLCDDFESAWIEGRRPRLEELLPRAREQDREALLRELLALEVEYRLRQGERCTMEEYRQRLPGYSQLLVEVFPQSTPAPRDWLLLGDWPSPGDRYAIEALVGQGGMGAVYRAYDRKLDRRVALKVIRPDAMTPLMRSRFEAEARAVAQLDHPHIIKIFDVGEMPAPDGSGMVPYLALEYIPGGSLARRLAGALEPALAARLVAQLARAMQHAHARGIVHRDLKPDNVLLAGPSDVAALNTPLGCPRITDFGLARRVESEQRLTLGTVVLGTPAYLAPEQAQGLPDVGPPADVYALGVILYRLLTGQAPFEADSLLGLLDQVRHRSPVPVRQVCPEVPDYLDRICLACLDKRPERRPSAAELAERLEQSGVRSARPGATGGDAWVQSVDTAPDAAEMAPGSRADRPLVRWAVAAGLIGAVVLTGVVALAGLGKRPPGTHQAPEQARAFEPPAAGPEEPLRVVRLDVKHFANLRTGHDLPTGILGKEVYEARRDDSVEVEALLSRQGHAYLIAYRPDGTEELCFPEINPPERFSATTDLLTANMPMRSSNPWMMALQAARLRRASGELEPPPLTDQPRYPSKSRGVNYGLNEGAGMQVFVLVASSQPLPEYQVWVARCGKAPWGRYETPAWVVWQDDGGPVEALTPRGLERSERGAGQRVAGKAELVRLTDWLRSQPRVEAVQAVGFAVLERK